MWFRRSAGRVALCAYVLESIFLMSAVQADELFYIERGSSWNYFRGLQEASSPDTTQWRELSFPDGSWTNALAPFGYGDGPFGTDLSFLVPPMQGNYTTLYLRQTFEVSDVNAVSDELRVRVDYDDAFVIWINDNEFLRVGAVDPLTHQSVGASHESGIYETITVAEPGNFLENGTNIIAVQVFNTLTSSSDLKFDMDLADPAAPDVTPPDVESIVPTVGAIVRTLSRVEVTFTEAVVGVGAFDLLINNSPAADVSGAGAGPYSFTFPTITAGGIVSVKWAENRGIGDVVGNPFDDSEQWAYLVDPEASLGEPEITELVASNADGLQDEDGETPDWFEVHNSGAESLALAGWGATDDRDERGKWTFPDVTLAPGEYLVVFASGKNRKPTNGDPLHVSFKLDANGEDLALTTPDNPRQVVSEINFPAQRAGFSYGFTGAGVETYFNTPTPGAANGNPTVIAGIVATPVLSVEHGFFDTAFDVELFTATPDATMYYTFDGSEPSSGNGTLYNGPIEIAGTPDKPGVTPPGGSDEVRLSTLRLGHGDLCLPRRRDRSAAGSAGFSLELGELHRLPEYLRRPLSSRLRDGSADRQ